MTADIELDRVTVRFGAFTAVEEASLRIRPGEFFSFLGPSGCGKTTILRTISGFIEPTSGAVRIGGRDMRGIGPNRRPTALIFQSLALFPMMSVADNVAYGLRVRSVGKRERSRRAEELLNIVALADQSGKRVDELSGGQRQRVAIARALAVEPQVLLLDEPLSALDLKLRQHMRNELRTIQRRVGITFIYITHDQGEALTMSDRIAVMNRGRIEQIGDGRSVYDHPETAFVASFVGETNALPGKVVQTADGMAAVETGLGTLRGRNPRGLSAGERAIAFVRPEALRVRQTAENACEAEVIGLAYEGNLTNVSLRALGGVELLMLQSAGTEIVPLTAGERCRLGFTAQDTVVLPSVQAAHQHAA
jgi:spermidine/putrescine transport system ATP-binding protein